MRHVAPLLLIAASCAQEIVVTRDGGPGAVRDGGVRDAGAIPGGRDAGFVDGGARDAGDVPVRDAGVRDAGPLPAVTFGSMGLPANTRSVHAIWGRSATEVWAGTGSGALLYLDGANGWTKVWQEPSNHGIASIDGTADRLFVASDSRLHVFVGDHTAMPTGYLIPQVRQVRQMTVRGNEEAYVVASLNNGRGFYHYDGSQLRTIAEPTDIAELEAVAALPGQPVFVGGNGRIYRYEQSTLTPETIEWPMGWDMNDILLFRFEGFGQVDGRVYAVGDRHMVFERGGDRTWRVVYAPANADDELLAIAGSGAVGFAVGGTSGGPIVRIEGKTIAPDPFAQNFDLAAVWAADANTWFASGWVANSFDGVILRGTR